MRTLVADLRYALRVLFRVPSFSLAVVAVLALGIGANTAIFSIVNTVLLRPLPFEDPDRLVRLFHEPPQNAFPGIHRFSVSPANFYDWKRDAHVFDSMAIYRFRQFTLTGGGNAEAVVAGAVGADFFRVVRASPSLGRVFLPEEDAPARSHVVILSGGFWKSRFGGTTDVIGRTLTLDGEVYSIIGVMPTSFTVASWAVTARDLWVPLAYPDSARAVRDNHNAQVIARLKPGVDSAQAQSEMNVISKRLEQDMDDVLDETLASQRFSTLLLGLFATSALALASIGIYSVLSYIVRGRSREIGIRSALGARTADVVRLVVLEGMTPAIIGIATGTVAALVSSKILEKLVFGVSASDPLTLAIVAGMLAIVALMASLVPAYRASRLDPLTVLRDS